MTKRRIIFLSAFASIIIILFIISQFVWDRHVKNIQIQEDIAAQEEAELEAQQAQELIEEQLISGNYTDPNLKIVFLTFNDGPTDYTDDVIAILNSNGVNGTFFVNGTSDEELQQLYKEIVDNGNVLGNHTYDHSYTFYSYDSLLNEITELNDLEKEIVGGSYVSNLVRFPGGSEGFNLDSLQRLVDAGYNYVDWNVDSGDDDSSLTTEEIVTNIIDQVHNQNVSVVLLHSEVASAENSREALSEVIQQLKSEGYTFMTIEDDYLLPRQEELTATTTNTKSTETNTTK